LTIAKYYEIQTSVMRDRCRRRCNCFRRIFGPILGGSPQYRFSDLHTVNKTFCHLYKLGVLSLTQWPRAARSPKGTSTTSRVYYLFSWLNLRISKVPWTVRSRLMLMSESRKTAKCEFSSLVSPNDKMLQCSRRCAFISSGKPLMSIATVRQFKLSLKSEARG